MLLEFIGGIACLTSDAIVAAYGPLPSGRQWMTRLSCIVNTKVAEELTTQGDDKWQRGSCG